MLLSFCVLPLCPIPILITCIIPKSVNPRSEIIRRTLTIRQYGLQLDHTNRTRPIRMIVSTSLKHCKRRQAWVRVIGPLGRTVRASIAGKHALCNTVHILVLHPDKYLSGPISSRGRKYSWHVNGDRSPGYATIISRDYSRCSSSSGTKPIYRTPFRYDYNAALPVSFSGT